MRPENMPENINRHTICVTKKKPFASLSMGILEFITEEAQALGAGPDDPEAIRIDL